MKILYKWRNFKNIRMKQKEQQQQNGFIEDGKTPGMGGQTAGNGSGLGKFQQQEQELARMDNAQDKKRDFFRDDISDDLEPSDRGSDGEEAKY